MPADPSMSEQEEAENSREEKRTEEHLESGRQEEGGRFCPFLFPLILSDSRDRRFEAQLRAAELGREAAQGRKEEFIEYLCADR